MRENGGECIYIRFRDRKPLCVVRQIHDKKYAIFLHTI